MIYTDRELRVWAEGGGVSPFDDTCVNPASIDLRLGGFYREPVKPLDKYRTCLFKEMNDLLSLSLYRDENWHKTQGMSQMVDLVKRFSIPDVEMFKWSEQRPIPQDGLRLSRFDFILCHSLEVTKIPLNAVAKLFLKSSAGRRGIEHLHAGYGDPGFEGQWTFELFSHWPGDIVIKPGDRLLQITLEECSGVVEVPYGKTGHYQAQEGATVAWTAT